ncbi:flagellar biosynthetic protein FliR, partial [Salmonella enterica subsp. enterica serovar Kentucky]|nr:flagellar biosynthetic protein FliR [Salmonella enterica subsp. enterica serovar Kentucky]
NDTPLFSIAALWLAMQQILIGIALGFTMQFAFAAVRTAGEFIDADQKYKQVQEAVLTKISFGYNILDYYFEGNNLIVTRVQPYEI